MNNIAKNLKLLISKEDISENELSKRVGIPQQVLNRIVSGSNFNPKLTTILPVAEYFKVPLQALIYEDLTLHRVEFKNSSIKIPFIDIKEMQLLGIDSAISNTSRFISVDMNPNPDYFATEMYDNSMEPKFPINSILIFEKNKIPCTGDFCLLKSNDNQYIFRQVMMNTENKKYIKCLNPSLPDFTLLPMPINLYVLATLLESRINFVTR